MHLHTQVQPDLQPFPRCGLLWYFSRRKDGPVWGVTARELPSDRLFFSHRTVPLSVTLFAAFDRLLTFFIFAYVNWKGRRTAEHPAGRVPHPRDRRHPVQRRGVHVHPRHLPLVATVDPGPLVHSMPVA